MDILFSDSDISPSSKRGLARNLFSGFYDRGLSANKALNELKAAGLSYRRQDFLSDYAQSKGSYDSETRIRFVAPGKIPSEKILEPKYFGTPDKYSMVFKYTGFDSTTGEDKEGYFFYHRNTLDTRKNMENDAQSWIEEQAANYGADIASVRVVSGYINPVWQ